MTSRDYLTVTEAAEALRLSVPTIKRYLHEGKLQSAKLPGGQHRIPRAEVERLLQPTPEGDSEAVLPTTPPNVEERLATLEQWVTDLQFEVERLSRSLEVVSCYLREHLPQAAPPDAGSRGEVLILGAHCRRCDMLFQNTLQAFARLDAGQVNVRRVTDVGEIAAYGPVLTPALVVNGELVFGGRTPSVDSLRELLAARLT